MLIQHQEAQSSGIFTNDFKVDSNVKKSRKWACTLSEIVIGNYLIVPLTSVTMLKSESYTMNNDCIDYAHRCANLNYCLFSIRTRSGGCLATLGLVNEDSFWNFDWCSGPSNIEVLEESLEYLDDEHMLQTEHYPTELYYVAHEVARLMNADSCH